MSVVGHEELLKRLTVDLPRVALFVGPPSVGRWTTAEHLRSLRGVMPADVLRVRKMSADEARSIVSFASSAPLGNAKLVIARLDGANPGTLHQLLKVLEEATEQMHFILISSELPLQTLASRAEIFRFPLLTIEQVEDVLLQRRFNPSEAKRWAAVSGGQVRRALDLAEGMDAKITVLAAVRAIRERDADALDNLASRWADEHTKLLGALCREAISGRWKVFDHAEVEGIGRKLPLSILFALNTDIRPRLVIRSSLMTILRGTQ